MTAFRTCKNCVLEREPCPRREAVKASIAGTGVTSVKFACAIRKPLYAPGDRVVSRWTVPDSDDYDERAQEEHWPATVIKEVGTMFQLKIDDVRSENDTPAKGYFKNQSLYVKARAGKLKPLDEPSQVVCDQCGRVGDDPVREGGCYVSGRVIPAWCAAGKAKP